MNDTVFPKGYDVSTYLGGLRNYRSLVKQLYQRAEPAPEHVTALRRGLAAQVQPVRATIMTEDWCGDSAANLPIIARLAEAAGVELRVFRGSEVAELKHYYEGAGVTHIPVVSLWDGEWREIARWVEAPAVVDRKKTAWKDAHPEFMRLYSERDHDKQAAKQFAELYRTFLDEMVRWYEGGHWRETTRELVEALPASVG